MLALAVFPVGLAALLEATTAFEVCVRGHWDPKFSGASGAMGFWHEIMLLLVSVLSASHLIGLLPHLGWIRRQRPRTVAIVQAISATSTYLLGLGIGALQPGDALSLLALASPCAATFAVIAVARARSGRVRAVPSRA